MFFSEIVNTQWIFQVHSSYYTYPKTDFLGNKMIRIKWIVSTMIEIHPSFMSHTFRTVRCQAAADDPKSFLITLLRASSCREFPLATGYEQVSKPKGTLVNTKISGLSGCPFLWWNWFNDPLQSFCLLLCKWEDGEFPPHHTSTQEIGRLSLGKPSWCGSIQKTMSALGLIPKTGCPANVFLNTPKISDTLHKVPCFAG